jgi:hypothetical protein
VATPAAPATPARRYALTGVFTDAINGGMVEHTFTHADPVIAAMAFLDSANAGFHTVLVNATPGDGSPSFAPYGPGAAARRPPRAGAHPSGPACR